MDESSVRKKMQEVYDMVLTDIGSIRTGRANTTLVEELEVEVYGGQERLMINELANISAPDAQTLVIEPWDKSVIGEIRKGILSANIGLNPSIDGEIIRIALPSLTTEDREKYTKLLSTKLENGRVMVRQIRQDAIKDIKENFQENEISEDERFNLEKKLQGITDEFTGKIDKAGEKKKQELMSV